MRLKLLAISVVYMLIWLPVGSALADTSEPLHLRPPTVPSRANAEYYPSSPEAGVTIPVHVWGNVREPGLHYMPLGSTLIQSVSAAGGPSEYADTASVKLLRGNTKPLYYDLLGPKTVAIQANDFIYVERSYRADLPVIIAGISTILSIITLYYVMHPPH